jgi:hypothetical protein
VILLPLKKLRCETKPTTPTHSNTETAATLLIANLLMLILPNELNVANFIILSDTII